MNLKCFTLMAMFVIIFSLGNVSASDNINCDASSLDDACLVIDNSPDFIDEGFNGEFSESHGILTQSDSPINGSEDVDLSVKMDVKQSYVKNRFNRAGSEVPWTITVMVNSGIAHDIKVFETLSDNLEYLSHNVTVGEYDSVTGIWNIGDLNSSNIASLTILTKLKTDGIFSVSSNLTTSSNDVSLSDNFNKLTIKSGSSKVTSNWTETSDDANSPQHNSHYNSENTHSVNRVVEEEQSRENIVSVPEDMVEKSKSDKNDESGSSSNPTSESNDVGDSNTGELTTTFDSLTKDISNTFESLTDSIFHIFDSDSSNSNNIASGSENNSESSPVKSVLSSNYSKTPIIIFAVFLIALVAIIGYNKIKS